MSKNIIWGIVGVVVAVAVVGGGVWAFTYYQNQQKIEESKKETEELSRAVDPVDEDDMESDDNDIKENPDVNPDNNPADLDTDSATPLPLPSPGDAPTVIKTGSLSGSGSYSASGGVKIIQDGDNVIIQLEDNFSFSGAPDTVLYLGANPNQRTIDKSLILGQLTSNSGKQAYQVSKAEFDQYGESVIIWCRAFNVYMGGANLVSGS